MLLSMGTKILARHRRLFAEDRARYSFSIVATDGMRFRKDLAERQ